MAVQRFKLSMNQARFPLVSSWGSRASLIPSMDTAGKSVRAYMGAEENTDYDIPQIIYGENFVPVSTGVKSVSYLQKLEPDHALPTGGVEMFDQIFPLRDENEGTVLYSPAKGWNYVLPLGDDYWQGVQNQALWTPYSYVISEISAFHVDTAHVTRAYIEGRTLICYSRIGLRLTSDPPSTITKDGSLLLWDSATLTFKPIGIDPSADIVQNLPVSQGNIFGIASSNGYLLVWSNLTVYWAPWDGAAFNFEVYANGEITGAGSAIPEDIKGVITALIPMSGGYIIFTTKNAVAAFYNANNFASPWIFKEISNAGGVEGFEQVASEGSVGSIYAYTTGGMQKLTLNTAEPVFPDVTDFLGGHFLETFDTAALQFEEGEITTEMFVKLQYCGQRFLVVSYGTYPGVYSYCLVYDIGLQRWGKLRIKHKDCFFYSYGSETAELTYNMLGDVSYDEIDPMTYDTATIASSNLTYPRQSIAFLQDQGEIRIAVLDWRDPVNDDSEAFIIIGRNQLTRARLATLQELEMDGLQPGGQVAVARSVNGKTLETFETLTLREQVEDYAEFGCDMVTGKNFTFFVKGVFSLSAPIVHASVDGSF
jgi:hypothetical protein